MVNYWIFVTANQPKYNLTNRKVVEERRKTLFYGLSRISSHQAGDKVLFYLAGDGLFIGEGEISKVLFELSEQEKKKYWLKDKYTHDFFHAQKGVEFSYIKYFDTEVESNSIRNELDFFKEASNPGFAFQGRNAKPISRKDFDKIKNLTGGLKMETKELNLNQEPVIRKEEINSQTYKELAQEGRIEFVTFHPAYSYEEFLEGLTVATKGENVPCESVQYILKPGIFKKLCKKALSAAIGLDKDVVEKKKWIEVYEEYLRKENINFKSAPKYVLIIDEINRGDIAKIFGELITLLEADKRIGAENELIVTLPNSGDKFGVPSNLYIIATMNTADRSIALLDIALRRRFGFIEMNPKFDILKVEHLEKNKDRFEKGVYDLLSKSIDAIEKINKEICSDSAIGRDRQIGHSFLFKVYTISDLFLVWRHEILPLMEEYCYSDYKKINRILFKKDSDTKWITEAEGIKDLEDMNSMLEAILSA